MAQKIEKEESELKVPENLPICTPLQTISTPQAQFLAARSSEIPDQKVLCACDQRTSSADSSKRPNLVSPVENQREDVGICYVRSIDTQIGTIAAMTTRRLVERQSREKIPWLELRNLSRGSKKLTSDWLRVIAKNEAEED
ncbi:hypothetical protein DH2020_003252 [Rehmannia glutinosa]|uniref:Uncharacterized protein n=1 Tax=Rehmannia glutinosa TaxID=99300 RepID=A0ABR0XLJ5_REHGL